ncbi:flavin reductase [Fulvivirga sp. RKSG066]|uniref:flavin reductase family protein n=1 Tax=Fulvivirga aurantia TaxID=2529383 RepID=UPI0012BCFA61|nr:flavin reductase family protein [Fulvivirga aurantia]MTI20210.1 flavin reductase [Fulvivirga aurantia]
MDTLKKLSYGQYIVTSVKDADEMTTRDKDFIAAGTINWVTQTSFEPPIMAIAVNIDSDLQETIEKSREFTVHILGEGQEDKIETFAQDSEITDTTINGIPYRRDENDQIIIDQAIGYITCKAMESISSGDHTLYLSKVINHHNMSDQEPITTQSAGKQYA